MIYQSIIPPISNHLLVSIERNPAGDHKLIYNSSKIRSKCRKITDPLSQKFIWEVSVVKYENIPGDKKFETIS